MVVAKTNVSVLLNSIRMAVCHATRVTRTGAQVLGLLESRKHLDLDSVLVDRIGAIKGMYMYLCICSRDNSPVTG